jgi:hypothetical protein
VVSEVLLPSLDRPERRRDCHDGTTLISVSVAPVNSPSTEAPSGPQALAGLSLAPSHDRATLHGKGYTFTITGKPALGRTSVRSLFQGATMVLVGIIHLACLACFLELAARRP